MSDELVNIYQERADSGLYDAVVEQLVKMDKQALGNVDYIDDFAKHVEHWSSNARFHDRGGKEFFTNIIGEIAGPVHGTVLRAAGNFYVRDGDFKPLDDKANVKDILALTTPTCATIQLANFFENQTLPLRHIISTEATQDEGKGYILKPWLRALEDNSAQDDLIIAHMLPKYGTPASAGTAAPVTPTRRAKRKLDDVTPRKGVSTSIVSIPARTAPVKPNDSEIKIGAFYDPHLLSDYGGPFFAHVQNKLLQLDVRDALKSNKLIPPWDFYDRLKPGTLVLARVSLHIFNMESGERKRKVYQINAHSVKVLADSDAEVAFRAVPVPKHMDRVAEAEAAADPEVSNAFDNFAINIPGVTSWPPTTPVASTSGTSMSDASALGSPAYSDLSDLEHDEYMDSDHYGDVKNKKARTYSS
ncbi:hypothetical protein B0H10DRAFT_2227830 [Mycena sp. CBHHK59/15]|nr:hypothetical protein B0H10DRAFT_2227830 [Mycena sp. CBHHK59/15]